MKNQAVGKKAACVALSGAFLVATCLAVPVGTVVPAPAAWAAATIGTGQLLDPGMPFVELNAKKVTSAKVRQAAKASDLSASKVTTFELTQKVKSVAPRSFAGYKKGTILVIETKKLTKASVKRCLEGSKVKKAYVCVSVNEKVSEKYAKKYKKYFTKANCGKKVSIEVAYSGY